MKYRKKPVVIEAVQFLENGMEKPNWLITAFKEGTIYGQGGESSYLTIKTLEGDHRANIGDWIIQGIKGELYPCKPDIFAATYEEAITGGESDDE